MSKNFWLNKKVLILGASGFIGSHMVDILVEKGARVSAQISNNNNKDNLYSSIEKIKFVKGDLLDQEFCTKALRGYDIVLNFAAVDGGGDFKKRYSSEILRANSIICLNVLEAARINRIGKLLLVSSITVEPDFLGLEKKTKDIITKSDIDGYSLSKIFIERAARIYSSQYGLDILIVRPGNIYGPRDSLSKGRVVTTFIKQAINNSQISLVGSENSKLALIHVEDFVRATATALEKSKSSEPLNIVGSHNTTLGKLALLIIRLTKSKSKLKTSSSKTQKTNIKLKSSFKFTERYSLEEGIKQTIEFIQSC